MVNKKAISPLIATLLLIAFTVALGVMIMNWGSTLVDYGTCDGVKISIPAEKNSMCYKSDTQKIFFIVKNDGNSEITSLIIRSENLDSTDASSRIIDIPVDSSKIEKGGKKPFDLVYSKPNNYNLEIIPKILVKNEEELCADKAVKINTLEECS